MKQTSFTVFAVFLFHSLCQSFIPKDSECHLSDKFANAKYFLVYVCVCVCVCVCVSFYFILESQIIILIILLFPNICKIQVCNSSCFFFFLSLFGCQRENMTSCTFLPTITQNLQQVALVEQGIYILNLICPSYYNSMSSYLQYKT